MFFSDVDSFFHNQRQNAKKIVRETKEWFSDRRHKKLFLSLVVNSLSAYVLAYLFAYVTHQVATMLVADSYEIPSVILNNKIDFLISSFSPLWTGQKVINVTGAGPIFSLILGTLFYSLFLRIRHQTGLMKLLVLWLFIHEMNLFFGGFIAGLFSYKGFGLLVLWLFMSGVLKIILSLAFIFCMVLIGNFSFSRFLATAPTVSLIKKNNRKYFIVAQVVLPWLLGGIVQFLITLPSPRLYESITYITLIFFIAPIMFNTSETKRP